MAYSDSKLQTVPTGLYAHAGAGLAALWDADARTPLPSDTSVIFEGKNVHISREGKKIPFDAGTFANTKIRSVDLIFKGSAAVDLETVVPAGSRQKTILNCENMVMEQSPFPEDACLCFWTARWKEGSWHVTASVTLAEPVLNVLDMLRSSGIRVRSVRRQPATNAREWATVPPWIRPSRRRMPRIPVWGASLAGALLLFAMSITISSSIRADKLEASVQQNRVDQALIARMNVLSGQQEARRTGQNRSYERISLIGRIAEAFPDTVSLKSFSVDGDAVQIEGRGGTAADTLRLVTAIEGLSNARLAGDVQRSGSGEIFVIEATLQDPTQ